MATKKELLEQSQKAIGEFFKISDFLLGDNAPYDINELKDDNPYYKTAKELADEMEVDWEKMTHEESNRVVINLLAEYYARIQPDDKYKPVLSITFQKAK
jgi:hypothetical protein